MSTTSDFMALVARQPLLQERLASAPGTQAYVDIAAEHGLRLSVQEVERELGICDDLVEERLDNDNAAMACRCTVCCLCRVQIAE